MDAPTADAHDDRLARAERYVLGVERPFRGQLALIERLAARGRDTGREEKLLREMQRNPGAMEPDRLRGKGERPAGGGSAGEGP